MAPRKFEGRYGEAIEINQKVLEIRRRTLGAEHPDTLTSLVNLAHSFYKQVDRIAPRAAKGDVQSQVNIYCRFDDANAKLRPGMTGYARVDCGQAPLAMVFKKNLLRFIRTEFWW